MNNILGFQSQTASATQPATPPSSEQSGNKNKPGKRKSEEIGNLDRFLMWRLISLIFILELFHNNYWLCGLCRYLLLLKRELYLLESSLTEFIFVNLSISYCFLNLLLLVTVLCFIFYALFLEEKLLF